MNNTDEPHKLAWDVFISHATEDKENFVEPLASALKRLGVDVWYDSYTLSLGDSLSRSIDNGLAKSKYGVVILSPAFFAKRWPEYELRGLTAKEIETGKVILPVWHNVTKADVMKFSPPLADKLAVDSKSLSPIQIAIKIAEIVRPDVLTRVQRRAHYLLYRQKAKTSELPSDEIMPGPIRHETLPRDLIGRIRLVRIALLEIHPHSMEFWIDGFQRDAHPSKEVEIWERIAATYCEFKVLRPNISQDEASAILGLLLGASMGVSTEKLRKQAEALDDESVEALLHSYAEGSPLFEFDEEISDRAVHHDLETIKKFEGIDREHFPSDIPNDLVVELLKQNVRRKKK